jgi:hypothetical protein
MTLVFNSWGRNTTCICARLAPRPSSLDPTRLWFYTCHWHCNRVGLARQVDAAACEIERCALSGYGAVHRGTAARSSPCSPCSPFRPQPAASRARPQAIAPNQRRADRRRLASAAWHPPILSAPSQLLSSGSFLSFCRYPSSLKMKAACFRCALRTRICEAFSV